MKYHFQLIARHVRREMKRAFRRNRLPMVAVILLVAVAGFGMIRERMMMDVNYSTLLSTIAEGESKGNYNAYFGNVTNSNIDFTAMTIANVLDWQAQHVAAGSPSSAVGKYQFIEPTLRELVGQMQIDSKTKFTPALQDSLAIRLIERRGASDYLHGRISREQFAHNLSQEWAALPRVLGDQPEASYYAGDGLNQARIGVDDVLIAIASLHEAQA